MDEPDRPYGRRADDAPEIDCEFLSKKMGIGACDTVLAAICRARNSQISITIWDLPKITGLPLHEAFAAVRTLEYGRLISVADNLSDPFGARLELQNEGIERLRELKCA